MSHRVDDVIHSELVGKSGHGNRIIRIVGVLPGVAHIHIEIDSHHQALLIVVDSAPARGTFHLGPDLSSAEHSQMPFAGNLDFLIQIEKDVHDGIGFRNIDDRPVRKDALHGCLKHGPIVRSVHIINQHEPAAQEMFSEVRGFDSIGVPASLTGLLHEQERMLEDAIVTEFQMDTIVGDCHVGRPTQGGQEVRFGVGIVDSPHGLEEPSGARAT